MFAKSAYKIQKVFPSKDEKRDIKNAESYADFKTVRMAKTAV
jgi:hypothetical protein